MAAPRSAPLAGRPPYATDEDDSIYDNPAPRTPRAARPPVDNPNDRTSAYNTYDSYIDNRSSNVSGSAGIGGALLAIDSDSDDETDLHSVPPQRNADPGSRAALYAAASGLNNPPPHSLSPTRSPTSPAPPYSPPANGQSPTDSKRGPGMSPPRSPGASSSSPAGGPLVSPRPVYAANTPSRQAAFDVNSQQPQHQPPNLSVRIPASPSANLRADVASRGPTVPSPAFMAPPANGGAGTPSTAGFGPIPGTPNELHPHPLQAPSTPITPIFAAPPRTVNFDDKSFNTPILRGDKEETLIARRGEKGDDFWRRFSMVAKEENSKPANQKTSQWLRSTQAGRSGFSRCVWVIAVILVLCIVGASVAGWYFTRNNPDHVRPTTFGGTAEEGMNGRGTSSIPTTSTTSSGGLVKIVHTSTSAAAAAVATEAKRSENDGLERIVARAFGQVASDMSAEKRDMPVVVKKVRQHQHAKRRTWQRMI